MKNVSSSPPMRTNSRPVRGGCSFCHLRRFAGPAQTLCSSREMMSFCISVVMSTK